MAERAQEVKVFGFQSSSVSSSCRLAFFLCGVLTPFLVEAHIGSPNVFFDGKAGPYDVRVAIRPPSVLPGSAQVDVRVDGGIVTNVTLEARLFDVTGVANQPTVRAAQVSGETNFFNGVLWFLRNGSYGIDVRVEGDRGGATVSVPLNSAAIRAPAMTALWKGLLIALGSTLFFGALFISAAVARDYKLATELPSRRDRTRAWIVASLVGLALGGGSLAAMTRWRQMDAEFRSNALYKPLPVMANAQTNNGLQMLQLEKADGRGPMQQTWETLAADHGKLMHLFLLKEPDYSAFAHLHPARRDERTFENILPPLPAGRYDLYAEITYDNGVNETLVTNLDLAGTSGSVPQMRFGSNDVICQSVVLPVGNSAAPLALDADDSWHVGNANKQSAGPNPNRQFCRLMGGATMIFEAAPGLTQNKETSLRFSLFRVDGSPLKLQPYMGMLGHAVVRRNDGAVFTHLHPMGTISMAAQNILSQRQAMPAEITNSVPNLPGSIASNSVSFPYAFPRSGQYRMWVQVRVASQVLTGVFDVTVNPG